VVAADDATKLAASALSAEYVPNTSSICSTTYRSITDVQFSTKTKQTLSIGTDNTVERAIEFDERLVRV
jgi:hypothetical protein